MPNYKIYWVLLAPGLASCFCFFTEEFVESLEKRFENIHCRRGRFW